MNDQQRKILLLRETDVDGVTRRLCGNLPLYESCLVGFLADPTMKELNHFLATEAWDDAFTAAHAIKGVAGNMGFVPLMHAVGHLVVYIRSGRLKEINAALEQVNSAYRDITDGINQYIAAADRNAEGEKL